MLSSRSELTQISIANQSIVSHVGEMSGRRVVRRVMGRRRVEEEESGRGREWGGEEYGVEEEESERG